MSSSSGSKKTYLVSGANRGIGNAIARQLLQRPDTHVIVTCRKQGPEFSWKSVGIEGQLDAVEMDLGSDKDSCAGITALFERRPDLKLDYVIAAHGSVTSMKVVDETNRQSILDHVNVNVNGVLRLWQPFSRIFNPNATFVALSSSCGSIQDMEPLPGLAYGVSKAGLNFLIKKIHQEHPEVTAVAVHPGWVKTNMGQFAADAWDMKEPPMEVDDSATHVLKLIDSMTREKSSGRFLSYDGTELHW